MPERIIMSAKVILSEQEMQVIRAALRVYVHETNPSEIERDIIAHLPEVLQEAPYDPYQRVPFQPISQADAEYLQGEPVPLVITIPGCEVEEEK